MDQIKTPAQSESQATKPQPPRRIRWLRFLRKAAGVIIFVTSLFGLAKMVLEFSDALEQQAEHYHSKR